MVERPPGPYAPYAPGQAIETVLRVARERGLHEPINAEVLERASVARTMTARTLRALEFLDLVDANGSSTAAFDAIRIANSSQLAGILGDVIRRAYRDVLSRIDPRNPTDGALVEAFLPYEPAAQRPRMIALFRSLTAKAGLLPGLDPDRPSSAFGPARRQIRTSNPSRSTTGPSDGILSALLQSLPANRRWSRDERDRWLQAWTSSLDLVITIDPPPAPSATEDNKGDSNGKSRG